MRHLIDLISEASQPTYTLYHGTCSDILTKTGWEPNSGQQGGNMGQTRYLYLTSGPEDAMWFAEEKGCSTVLVVRDVPADALIVDPEDGTYDTVEDELNSPHGLPGKVALTRALGPEHFSVYEG
jgi:hypothetical protein